MRGACPVARYRRHDRRSKPLHRHRGAHGLHAGVHADGRRQGPRRTPRTLPADLPLQINFNVFARDFDSETLLRVFSKFAGRESHLTVAVELVESDEIDFEKAQLAIEELGRAGIKSYIDDFGTGYSSIERVARLAVHGVKLDRSFAMSPPDSVLGRMLVQVIDMIKTSGHLIVVEGVETEASAQSAALHRRCRLRPGICALAPAWH